MISRATPRHRQRIAESNLKENRPTGRNRGKALAYINHGRWVADCPCNGAELVSEAEDMLCGSCGRTTPVDFPDATLEIERLLLLREPRNRNWDPGETVDQLLADNVANGIWEDM